MPVPETPLKEVERIEPIVREHAATTERERRLAAPVAKALRDAGLYRLWRPRALGGFQLDPIAGFQVLEAVARIDSAAGWNLQIASAFDMFGQWFDETTARELFGPDAIIGGALNPPRRAVPAVGGYRVWGRTPGSDPHGHPEGTGLYGEDAEGSPRRSISARASRGRRVCQSSISIRRVRGSVAAGSRRATHHDGPRGPDAARVDACSPHRPGVAATTRGAGGSFLGEMDARSCRRPETSRSRASRSRLVPGERSWRSFVGFTRCGIDGKSPGDLETRLA
jgi:hypothetical protein